MEKISVGVGEPDRVKFYLIPHLMILVACKQRYSSLYEQLHFVLSLTIKLSSSYKMFSSCFMVSF